MNERSEAQREASRLNGAKSKGPISSEGKAKVALNSLTHGCTALTKVLKNENPTLHDEMRQAFYDAWEPANDIEGHLVESIFFNHWRMLRVASAQTGLLDLTIDNQYYGFDRVCPSGEEGARTGLAIRDLLTKDKTFDKLDGYMARYQRLQSRAIDQLRAIQRERRARQTAEDAAEQAAEALRETTSRLTAELPGKVARELLKSRPGHQSKDHDPLLLLTDIYRPGNLPPGDRQ